MILWILANAGLALAQSQLPVYKADVNLQSLAVQVTDKQGREVRGLSAADFTILEEGRPQKIAWFGAEEQPISLVVLLDSSSSMESSKKLTGARAILGPLLRGNMPEDEIYLTPFTDRVGPFRPLSAGERANPPAFHVASGQGGTALYDALATSLCRLHNSQNVRRAVVVVTDGSDQHSRLRLQQMIQLAQASQPQIFMVGFFNPGENEIYRQAGKTVSLVSGREIDNPLQVFERISRETGAESFFPASPRDLERVIAHILGILQAQYTLAYYPRDLAGLRRIQVKVNRPGVTVVTRHSVGSQWTEEDSVHFSATSCEVSSVEHPYPWEPHVSQSAAHTSIYQDDFADPRSGWPNHAGSRYASGAYELSRILRATRSPGSPAPPLQGGMGDATLAAYGPWWQNFRASLTIESSSAEARGMVFRLNSEGCYVLLLSGNPKGAISFKLVKKTFWNHGELPLLPWTQTSVQPGGGITVECIWDRIRILINGVQVTELKDSDFPDGIVGMAQYGYGRTLFRNLRVEALP